MLYILYYSDSSLYLSYLLILLEIAFVVTAIYVINAKNPIVSVLFLIILFLLVSIYLITVGLDFLGISYLLVYIGAVSILFLFILMLIDIRVSELQVTNTNSLIAASFLFIYVVYSFYDKSSTPDIKNVFIGEGEIPLGRLNEVSQNNFEGSIVDNFDIIAIGNILYTNYSL